MVISYEKRSVYRTLTRKFDAGGKLRDLKVLGIDVTKNRVVAPHLILASEREFEWYGPLYIDFNGPPAIIDEVDQLV